MLQVRLIALQFILLSAPPLYNTMRKAQGVVPALILFFFFAGCSKISWPFDKLVRVHFSPAITVEQAAVYATMHEAKINQYSLSRMTISETDSGEVAIEYSETKPDDMTYRRKDRENACGIYCELWCNVSPSISRL